MDRASAVLILNSTESGVPEAILEGSVISAQRTAASAALAARCLNPGRPYHSLGVIGCGYINYEICRFLAVGCPGISRIVLFDKDPGRAVQVAHGYADAYGIGSIQVAEDITEVFKTCDLISFATTATSPHVEELSLCPGSTVLHVSLRDLGTEVILSADNIVDDADHVCRAQTSLHLAEQHTGNRDFIRCSLADILNGKQQPRCPERASIFSPFGLGILDLALGSFARSLVEASEEPFRVPSFLPDRWEHELRAKNLKARITADAALV
jgi:ornithine cyclodeaminase